MKMMIKRLSKRSRVLSYVIKMLQNYRSKRIQKSLCKRLRRHGPAILVELYEELPKTGVKHHLDFGSMLGAVREHGFIPHDIDIDIAIYPCGVEIGSLFKKMLSLGYQFHRGLVYEGELFEMTFIKSGIHVDLFIVCDDGEKCWAQSAITIAGEKRAKRRYRPYPTSYDTIELNGYKVVVPGNYDELLTTYYGSDWRLPNPDNLGVTNSSVCVLPGRAYQVDEEFMKRMKGAV